MSTNFAIQPDIVNGKPGPDKIRIVRVSSIKEPSAEVKWELAGRIKRLNDLAKTHPFNRLHRVKKYDPL